ncbi:MAG: sugar phosphate isomerase/epimerase family protein [Treponemataceae bacterium]
MFITARTQRVSEKFSVDETFTFFQNSGFQGIEFCLDDYFFRPRPDFLEDFFIEHTVETSRKTGLPISSVSYHVGFACDDKAFAFIKKAIPKVRKFGTDIMILNTADKDQAKIFHYNECYAEFKKRLGVLLDIADAEGVRLALEPEPPQILISTADFLLLRGEMKRDIWINFDIGHAFLTDADIFESIKALKGKIAHVHVDNMKRGEHLHRLPDDGDINLPDVFKALKTVGFDGAMALDLYVHEYDKEAPGCARRLKEMLAEI